LWEYAKSGGETARVRYSCTTLGAGDYEVFAWWADFPYSMGANVAYEVFHTGGSTTVRVDQNTNGGQWVSLGTYDIAAGAHRVEVHNGQAAPGTYIVADAVRFVPSTPPETGSLQVAIEPQGAIDAGAQWRVDGGAWRSSGAVASDLPAGDHTVEYSDVSGYACPASQMVSIQADTLATTTGTYTAIEAGAVQVFLGPP
jgi:hypothetical protein